MPSDGSDDLSPEWLTWEAWFAELEESHTTHASLPWFRSNDPRRSWVTSAGQSSTLQRSSRRPSTDLPSQTTPQPRSPSVPGSSHSRIARAQGIPFDPDPESDGSDHHSEERVRRGPRWLGRRGCPIVCGSRPGVARLRGWRVNYDSAILGLAQRLRVPYAPWTSDRYPRRDAPGQSRSPAGRRLRPTADGV